MLDDDGLRCFQITSYNAGSLYPSLPARIPCPSVSRLGLITLSPRWMGLKPGLYTLTAIWLSLHPPLTIPNRSQPFRHIPGLQLATFARKHRLYAIIKAVMMVLEIPRLHRSATHRRWLLSIGAHPSEDSGLFFGLGNKSKRWIRSHGSLSTKYSGQTPESHFCYFRFTCCSCCASSFLDKARS